MILRKLTPKYFGPFYSPCPTTLTENLTIFTGANDTGKSYALKAIDTFCNKVQATEECVNVDRHGEFKGAWNDDPKIQIDALLEVTENDRKLLNQSGSYKPGDIVEARLALNKTGSGYHISSVRRGNSRHSTGRSLVGSLPRVVYISNPEPIRNVIDIVTPNSSEDELLKLAFGESFSSSTLTSVGDHMRENLIARAEEEVNLKLQEILPSGLALTIRMRNIGGESRHLACYLVDEHAGYVPLSFRGSGISRVLGIMSHLLRESLGSIPTILLLDEPESSLHADAQHQLRRVLEKISLSPTVQVVYATHSPAMILSRRPDCIRVFKRTSHKGKATTIIDETSYGENFQTVRVCLGLTPSDSLLYGSATVIVEGATEVRCLEPILKKLGSTSDERFRDIGSLMDGCLFVSGEGNNIPKYCKIACAQNASPIVLLDGDKAALAQRIRDADPSVPIIQFEQGEEFEDVVPLEFYLAAVSDEISSKNIKCSGEITVEKFQAWLDASAIPEQMMTSKKVEKWIKNICDGGYSKHSVMERAIELTPAAQLKMDAFAKLVAEIRTAL